MGFIFCICTMPSRLLMVQTISLAGLEETLKSAANFVFKAKYKECKYIHILYAAVQILKIKYYA